MTGNVSPEILESVLRKLISEVKEVKLIKFRDEYIDSVKDTHSASYVKSIECAFNKLLKFSGNISLLKYDVRYLEKFINHIFKRSKYSAALYYRTLKAAFNKAADWNYIPANPFYKIKLPKFQKEPPVYITYSELEKILKFIPDQLKEFYQVAFFTGLRLSELINLKWNNINLKDRVIKIGDDEFTTKGKKVRFIPICNQVFEILQKNLPKVLKLNINFVFEKKGGCKYSTDYLSKMFKKAVRKSRINSKIHFHSLRHSFASNLIREGASIYHIKSLLGHSSISVTEIYSHVDMNSLRKTVNKFNHISGGLNG